MAKSTYNWIFGSATLHCSLECGGDLKTDGVVWRFSQVQVDDFSLHVRVFCLAIELGHDLRWKFVSRGKRKRLLSEGQWLREFREAALVCSR